MRLTSLDVSGAPTVDIRYPAVLSYEAGADLRVVETCYFFSDITHDVSWLDRRLWFGDGPYCLAPERGAGPGSVTTMLATGYAGTYRLEAYLRYRDSDGGQMHRSNRVSTEVTVAPRYPSN